MRGVLQLARLRALLLLVKPSRTRLAGSRRFAIDQDVSRQALPMIHYLWAVGAFDKRTYQAWDIPPKVDNRCYARLRELILAYRRDRLLPAPCTAAAEA
jgi:hypothetical protein